MTMSEQELKEEQRKLADQLKQAKTNLTFGTGKYSNTLIGGSGSTTISQGPYTISSSAVGLNSGYVYSNGTSTVSSPWGPTTTSMGTIQAKDVVIDGVSLKQILEDRLAVMIPNPELEKEWENLKALGDQYRALEADIKEKAAIWAALKAEDR